MRPLHLPAAVVLSLASLSCDAGPVPVCDGLEGMGCDDCYDGTTRCAFDGVEVTERSCQGCQARVGVLQEMCASGSELTVAEIDAGMTCAPVEDTPPS